VVLADGGADKRPRVKLEDGEMTIADQDTTTTTMTTSLQQQQPEMTSSSAGTCLSRDLSQGDDVVSSTSDVLTGDYEGLFHSHPFRGFVHVFLTSRKLRYATRIARQPMDWIPSDFKKR